MGMKRVHDVVRGDQYFRRRLSVCARLQDQQRKPDVSHHSDWQKVVLLSKLVPRSMLRAVIVGGQQARLFNIILMQIGGRSL